MKNQIKIAKFNKIDDKFVKDGYDEYTITYLLCKKLHLINIVVNGFQTKQKLNLLVGNQGYKKIILQAIQEFKNKKENSAIVKKQITLNDLSNSFRHNIYNYLLPISKIDSRDLLTKFDLI